MGRLLVGQRIIAWQPVAVRWSVELLVSIDWLHWSRVFTKLDLGSGYHQLRIHPDVRHKTAFVTPDGFYEWTVIPFGLANPPSACMRTMHCILGLYKRFAIEYLDDMPIFSRCFAKPNMHVDTILLAISVTGGIERR